MFRAKKQVASVTVCRCGYLAVAQLTDDMFRRAAFEVRNQCAISNPPSPSAVAGQHRRALWLLARRRRQCAVHIAVPVGRSTRRLNVQVPAVVW